MNKRRFDSRYIQNPQNDIGNKNSFSFNSSINRIVPIGVSRDDFHIPAQLKVTPHFLTDFNQPRRHRSAERKTLPVNDEKLRDVFNNLKRNYDLSKKAKEVHMRDEFYYPSDLVYLFFED